MKSFALAAMAAATTQAAVTRSFQRGVGANGTSGQFVRLSDAATDALIGSSVALSVTTKAAWQLTVQGVFYEDTGEEKIRLTHELTADLFASDVVTFEVSFRPSLLGDPQDINSIGEDYVTCEMAQSSSDGAFWTATVSEGYYLCKNSANASNVCTDPTVFLDDDSSMYVQTPESTSDWVTPYTDDDPDDFWCTKANTTKGADLNPFECTALKCIVERDFDTGDETRDLKFQTTDTTTDSMVIQPGRAKLYINKTASQFAFAARNDYSDAAIELTLNAFASNLVTAGATLMAATFALMAF